MTRQPLVARRAEDLLGTAVVATAPVAGGDISTATKLRLSDGTTALMKTLPHAPAGFFAAEAAGLRWLAEAADGNGGVAVPDVLGADHECLIVRWVEPGRVTVDAATAFGEALARTHAAGAVSYGTSPHDGDGFIGRLPLPSTSAGTWAEFYATSRVQPYLRLARDRDAVTAEDAADVEAVLGRLAQLVPAEPPARLHGDLWNGNVLWGADGRGWVIDPAAHGGHRETDLAMLSLFGLPHLARVLEAYDQAAPLAEGWESRQPLHQLFPLLVHACHFGGGYASRAAEAARRFLESARDPARARSRGVGPRGTAAVAGCPPGVPPPRERRPPTPIPPDGVVCPCRGHDVLDVSCPSIARNMRSDSQARLSIGWQSERVPVTGFSSGPTTASAGGAAAPRSQVLVVDDDRAVRESLRRSLEFNGYAVSLASDGAEALAGIGSLVPDVVIMDVMMPRLDGIEATRALRAAGNDVPILVLTARDAVGDRVEGLDAGADDYLTKPFALQELLARLRALLRRAAPQEGGDEVLSFSDLTMDLASREVRRGDRPIELTRTEFTLLEMFLRRPRRVLERSFILEEVWGYDFPTTANSLEVYVGYLRRKTEAGDEPRLLHTVRGVGYVLKEA
jgi:DNA-binding response OmpR family regulator/fructosamine-3-kinase